MLRFLWCGVRALDDESLECSIEQLRIMNICSRVKYGCQDAAGEPSIASSRLSERNERWSTSLSKRGLRKPGGYPHHIESGGNKQVQKSCLGQANVARAPQIPDPNAL